MNIDEKEFSKTNFTQFPNNAYNYLFYIYQHCKRKHIY